ncbi:hypothetical protein EIN_020530 [Entamoeba invadens IP1]|uniref:hypothetical protein n=1 Tax=Entamoeba invadens IP1 TaxID=370355 RepID=UPI0002C3F9DF|nr:hypothetical protein EIN_020530 [Entamoeba invadens IP1]ELP90584.1 hypothetical protein EIN_020530 [Entamoeba invadens IP1]|eukprot:XP_004257355.1 hypothetical protein EIN_020530 [Entamoeba invadens IP1]
MSDNCNTHSAFKFWSKKDRETTVQPNIRLTSNKSDILTKDYIWMTVLKNDTPYDEYKCVQQLSEVTKVWSIISKNTNTKDKQHFDHSVENMIRENYRFVCSERTQWEELLSKTQKMLSEAQSENETLRECMMRNNTKEVKEGSVTLNTIYSQITNVLNINVAMQSSLKRIEQTQFKESNMKLLSPLQVTQGLPKSTSNETTSATKVTRCEEKNAKEKRKINLDYCPSTQPKHIDDNIIITDYKSPENTQKQIDEHKEDIEKVKTKQLELTDNERCTSKGTLMPTINRLSISGMSKSSGALISHSVQEQDLFSIVERSQSFKLIKMPNKSNANSIRGELFVSPSLKRNKKIFSLSSTPVTSSLESAIENVIHSPRKSQPTNIADISEVTTDDLIHREMCLKKREEDVLQKEINIHNKEKEVLVVQIETENHEEELQAWEDELKQKEETLNEKQGDLLRRETELESKEDEYKKRHFSEKNECDISTSNLCIKPQPSKQEIFRTTSCVEARQIEELKKEKDELVKNLQDKQLRVWTLEEQTKRIERISKMMDLNEPSEEEVTSFVETIREIVNRKKQKIRFVITQKLSEAFYRPTTPSSSVVSPRTYNEKSGKKKLEMQVYISPQSENKNEELYFQKDNCEVYRTICKDFYMKEKDYLRILDEFYEVYLEKVDYSSQKEFPVEIKETFEPILVLTKQIVSDLDLAFSDPTTDEEEKSTVRLGSILENHAESLRVYAKYILKCPYFLDVFPVFSQSQKLTDSLVKSITGYIKRKRAKDSGFVGNTLLPVSTYLVTPILHFTEYGAVMRDLALNVSKHHFDFASIWSAFEKIESVEGEVDREKSLTQRKDNAKRVGSLFLKDPGLLPEPQELYFFGFLRVVDVDKVKVQDDVIRVCFVFEKLFLVSKIKTFQGKVLEKKTLLGKFFQEISGNDVGFLDGFCLEPVTVCRMGEDFTVSIVMSQAIKNAFIFEADGKSMCFSASSKTQQTFWCEALLHNSL